MFQKYGAVTDIEIIFNERGSKVSMADHFESRHLKKKSALLMHSKIINTILTFSFLFASELLLDLRTKV